MAYEFTQERTVEFSETDMAGIMHFSNYFRYMEATEHAFFRSLGETVHVNEGGRMQGWARVHASCDYDAPLHYEDQVAVRLLVRQKKASSFSYDFIFSRIEPGGPQQVARGALTVVCVAREPGESRINPVPIPEHISRLIEIAPPELLRPQDS